ncbi:MAG TPA: MMPL family transporter [Phycisphaerae bacterium]|nr:MMPL family transporter [Phycisphaerae bacterium]
MGFLQRRMVKGVMTVVTYPKVTLGICAVLLVASVVYAQLGLSLSTDENALLTQKLQFFKDYLRFDAKFPENEAFVVIVQPRDYAHPPLAKRWIALADEIAGKLRALKEDVDRVDARAPLDQLGSQALLFDDWADLKEKSAQMQREVPLLKILGEKQPLAKTLILGGNMMQRFYNAMAEDPSPNSESKEFVTLITRSLNEGLRTEPEKWVRGGAIPELTDLDPAAKYDPEMYGYYMIPDATKRDDPAHKNEKILIINVYENRSYSTLADVSEPLRRMRETLAAAAKDYPEFYVGITGRPALEADEMRTSDEDTKVAEICGLSLVFVVLWLFLRRVWMVIVAELCLGVGIGWTFGWATLAVGRLNLLSLVFVIALIGIGMDYLIQILTRYRYEKKRYTRPTAIWARVFRYVSPPIFTACLGAAGAFLVSKLTDFAGAGELGVIASGGLLLCLLSGYTLLPALLTLWPSDVGRVDEADRYVDPSRVSKAGGWRLIVPGLWVVVAIVGLSVALPPQFDPDLIKLQAQGLESVRLVHKLPTWYAAVMSEDLGRLAEARKALTPKNAQEEQATSIARTDSILEAIDKQKWLAAHNSDVAAIQWTEPRASSAVDLRGIADAAEGLAKKWGTRKDLGDDADLQEQVGQLVDLLRNAGREAPNVARLWGWEKMFLRELREDAEIFVPGPLDLQKLPSEVRDHYVSYLAGVPEPRSERQADGAATRRGQAPATYAMYVYPKKDLWAHDYLGEFVHELESRLAGVQGVTVTGIAVQLYHSTEEIHHAFLMATVYALSLIFVLVLADLRRLGQTVLAISVLAFGLPMLLLMMWAWRRLGEPMGIPGTWNFANFFGLPILIGAGHEYGVFMVHRYRETLHDPRRVWQRWDVSDKALLLCAIVTSCSFGFLAFARHRGLASLGWVMAVGTACIYLATIVVLRPILQWRLQRKGLHGKAP